MEDCLARRHELSFLLTLGDVIDGNATQQLSLEDLERVATVFDRLVGATETPHKRNPIF